LGPVVNFEKGLVFMIELLVLCLFWSKKLLILGCGFFVRTVIFCVVVTVLVVIIVTMTIVNVVVSIMIIIFFDRFERNDICSCSCGYCC
jgi:hypothetical protein